MAKDGKLGRWIAILLLLLLAVAGAWFYFAVPPPWKPPVPAVPAAPPAPAPAGPAAPAAEAGPQFDVLRVDSGGNAVIAGRADPGAVVTIRDGDRPLGTATADANGAFAFLPDAPLPPGAQQLSLSETLPGGRIVQGQTSASVEVAANASGQSLAVITGPHGSRIVSGQGPLAGALGLGAVDYDADGQAIFSGTAPAGDRLSLSLDGTLLGTPIAGPDGRWSLAAKLRQSSGRLRLTDPSKPGMASLTAPFALETLKNAAASGHIVIAPGQNLWLIARRIYGRGTLYTLIYGANATLIHDPNLIFPGQAFAIPEH